MLLLNIFQMINHGILWFHGFFYYVLLISAVCVSILIKYRICKYLDSITAENSAEDQAQGKRG